MQQDQIQIWTDWTPVYTFSPIRRCFTSESILHCNAFATTLTHQGTVKRPPWFVSVRLSERHIRALSPPTIILAASLPWIPAGSSFFQQLDPDVCTRSGGCTIEGLSHGQERREDRPSLSTAIRIYGTGRQMSSQEPTKLFPESLGSTTTCLSSLQSTPLPPTRHKTVLGYGMCCEGSSAAYCFPSVTCSEKFMPTLRGEK